MWRGRGEGRNGVACIQYPEGLRREQLTVLTGYRRSTRDAYIQRLRERGYLETTGDKSLPRRPASRRYRMPDRSR